MTNREKAIVTAYTGICMFEGEEFKEFYSYLSELYGRPVYTHELVTLDIKERSKDDFIELCRSVEPETMKVIRCKDCKYWHREIQNGIEYFNFSFCILNHYGDGHYFYCSDAQRR